MCVGWVLAHWELRQQYILCHEGALVHLYTPSVSPLVNIMAGSKSAARFESRPRSALCSALPDSPCDLISDTARIASLDEGNTIIHKSEKYAHRRAQLLGHGVATWATHLVSFKFGRPSTRMG